MTTTALPFMDEQLLGASSATINPWESTNWAPLENLVNRLKMRIEKATREGKLKLCNSFLPARFRAKLLAIKRVTSNHGRCHWCWKRHLKA